MLNHCTVCHPQNTCSELLCEQEINVYHFESLILWGCLLQQLVYTESTFMSIEKLGNLLKVTESVRRVADLNPSGLFLEIMLSTAIR